MSSLQIEKAGSGGPVLTVEGLTKVFTLKKERKLYAVDNVSLSIHRGEILGIIGESGCGKSTMSRSILRLIEPTDGRVILGTTELQTLSRKELKAVRKEMQMIFQDPFGSLNPRRSVYDIIAQSIRTHNLAHSQEEEAGMVTGALEDVGLSPAKTYLQKYPGLISGGQLQRVSIARVLALQPSFVIADEPVSMLDVSVRIGVLDLIRDIRDRYGISFMYITHDLSTARYICDKISIMYLGTLVESGPTEDILRNPIHPYTKALIAAVPSIQKEHRTEELPIKGFVPVDPSKIRHRCRFADRCPQAEDICFREEPETFFAEEGHSLACHVARRGFSA